MNRLFGFKKRRKYSKSEIDPDEIFLDSRNLPDFNKNQFEGRIERPISKKAVIFFSAIFFIVIVIFSYKAWDLQITHGQEYAKRSENNRMQKDVIFSQRGVIYDTNKVILAWNEISDEDSQEFAIRKYKNIDGLGHILGYIKYPKKDRSGFYYQNEFIGMDGVEKYFDGVLSGENGLKLTETDARGNVQSEAVVKLPVNGKDLEMTIDYRLQEKFYEFIKTLAKNVGFSGGAGIIMNAFTGEVITSVSYPEYSSQVMTDGIDRTKINLYLKDTNKPFLDRISMGVYAPGSIVKPFLSLAALFEKIIEPTKTIFSSGSISIQNPYDPTKSTVFNDWRPQGWVDMRQAIAVSSDVYFYEIGGGFQDQKGLGIVNIKKYMEMFGFGTSVADSFWTGEHGVIPDPDWKKINFDGEDWRIGDTYHTAIGQYGTQVTPAQVIQAVSSIINGGSLVKPTILKGENRNYSKVLPFTDSQYKVVREGMRLAVTEGTAKGLDIPQVKIAAKTGTAEVGMTKKRVNSWVIGFYPYENPKYVFTVMMEKGPYENTIGALYVLRQMIEWMSVNTPEYLN